VCFWPNTACRWIAAVRRNRLAISKSHSYHSDTLISAGIPILYLYFNNPTTNKELNVKKNKKPEPVQLTVPEKINKIKAIPFTYGRKLTNLTTDDMTRLGKNIFNHITFAKIRTASWIDVFDDLFNIHERNNITIDNLLIF
jgi:hypothetical protein